MCFPTLVEVRIAQMFLSLGMQRGVLLAYLLADPELSLESIPITNSVIGRQKTAVYVALVTVSSTLAGLLFGAWLEGMSVWVIVILTGSTVSLALIALWTDSQRGRKEILACVRS